MALTKNKNTYPLPDDDDDGNGNLIDKAIKEVKENPIKTVGTIITILVGGGLFS